MLIYQGGYKTTYHYYRNTCGVYENDDEIFNRGALVRKKWWWPFAPLMDWAVILWKSRGNPAEIFGYPNVLKFNYADFYEYRSRMGEVIYQSLVHYKKMHDTDKAMSECDYMEGLESAIWSFWFISGCENENSKTVFDAHGYDFEYSPEADAQYQKGMKWYAENFGILWD